MRLQRETRNPYRFAVAVIVLAVMALATPAQAQTTICYVDDARPNDSGDGSSWGAAKKTIQAAVDIGAPFLCEQIWVRKGTYVLTSPLTIDFRTPDIYGGFAGGEFQLSHRDWMANTTTIDGNLAVPYVVVIQNAAAPIIDGFVITRGGGGIEITDCLGWQPIIRNNDIHGNVGSGIYVDQCSPAIVNNLIRDNSSVRGGGLDLWETSAAITNNTIEGNTASGLGGGIHNFVDATPTINNNIVWGNTASISANGHQIYNWATSAPLIEYNDIDQNGYGDAGGGADALGNIRQDPLFYGLRYHLRANSPAIDAGTNAAPALPAFDYDNDPRIIDGDENGSAIVDMGADELEPGQTFGIWYVDGGVTTTGSGTSWSDPVKTLHEAAVSALAGEEIWVKGGTYFLDPVPHFTNDVGVYGGFAGGETQRDQRDPSANETVLDGDGPGFLSTAAGVVLEIDGFTITRTGLNLRGGTLSNCRIGPSSGISMESGTVRNCHFEGNTPVAISGSGTVEDSVFVGNGGGAWGGAVHSTGSTGLTIDRCKFFNNSATTRGGAIFTGTIWAPIVVRNSLFVGNHAGAAEEWNGSGGGAIHAYHSGVLTVENSTFYGNSVENNSFGGAIGALTPATSFSVTNSVFWNNTAIGQPDFDNFYGSTTVSYSDIDPTVSGTGNINADPLFIDPDGADNVLGTEDDDLRLGSGSPAVDAGNNSGIDVCSTDLDRLQRFLDDPGVTDTGSGTAPLIDMGAYERGGSAEEYTLMMAVTGSGATDPVVGPHDYPVCSVVTVTATPAAGWAFSNWTGDVADPNSSATTVSMLGDRTATANFFQPASADVGIDKTNFENEVMPGETVIYEIVAWSFGPSSVSGVTVTDLIPSELESCAWTCDAHNGTTCTASGSGDIDDTVSFPATSWMLYTVTCSVKAGASGSVSNTATVTLAAGDLDPNLEDNGSTDTDAIVAAGGCGSPDNRDLTDLKIEDQRTFEACISIAASNLEVQLPDGDVTLRAGSAVSFSNGFEVADGCSLSVQIDPTLMP